ncbi:hypothetical protein D556_1073 [Bordetella holmesii 41130]|nr:hypothetical protein D558_1064 [Bordetella holmesii 44057]EWM42009.1 hypothetical protein D556_1073 [Bordetella holmesii 41130]
MALNDLRGARKRSVHRVYQYNRQSLRGEQGGNTAAHGACTDDGQILDGEIHDEARLPAALARRLPVVGVRAWPVSRPGRFSVP